MCGIAGMVGTPDRAAVERMVAAMVTRGPDAAGLHAEAQVVLGHRRLSIVDLSSAASQPMSRQDGKLWIVFNGELYNFRELRVELEARGQRFQSHSDTEVLLAAYQEYGFDCLKRCNGMFAFAIWDRTGPEPVLFLARDHFGIKPLLYATTPAGLLFASELRALRQSGMVSAAIDRVALAQYFTYGHAEQPRTLLAEVRMLPAAHAMSVRPGQSPKLWRYWDLDLARSQELSRGMSYPDQTARVRELLEAAVRRQMVSDVPLGAFLSGGVDSSAAVALMTRAINKPIRTFTISYGGLGKDIDESEDAQRSADHLGAVHTAVTISPEEVAASLPQIAGELDQPSYDGVNTYFVSKAARTEVTVAISGLGGDEVFCGYRIYPFLAGEWATPPGLRRRVQATVGRAQLWRLIPASHLRERVESAGLRGSLAADYSRIRMLFLPSAARRLARAPEVALADLLAGPPHDEAGADPLSRISRMDLSTYMRSQLLRDSDATSMAHSLELRVPYLDVPLVEFVYGLPGSSKVGPYGGSGLARGKRVLVDAVRDLIPEFTYLKPKRGFNLPHTEWLRGGVGRLMDEVFNDRSFREQSLFDPDEAAAVRTRFQAGQGSWPGLWSILMLFLWSRKVLA